MGFNSGFKGLKLVPPVVSIHASGPYIMQFLRRSGRESRLYFTVPNNKLDIQT